MSRMVAIVAVACALNFAASAFARSPRLYQRTRTRAVRQQPVRRAPTRVFNTRQDNRSSLPRGFRSSNGDRYYGNLNNRYYGPQYGYF